MDNLNKKEETKEEKEKRLKAWRLKKKKYWFNHSIEEKGIKNIMPDLQVGLLPFTPEQEQLETLMIIKEQGKDFFYDTHMCTEFPTKAELEEIEERRKNQRVVSYYKKLGFKGVKIKENYSLGRRSGSKNMSKSQKKYWENLTEKQREARSKKIGKGIKKARKNNNWKSNKGEKRSHKYDG